MINLVETLFYPSVAHAYFLTQNSFRQDWMIAAGLAPLADTIVKRELKKARSESSTFDKMAGSKSLRVGATIAVGLAMSDGPLPFGDVAAATVLIGFGLYQ